MYFKSYFLTFVSPQNLFISFVYWLYRALSHLVLMTIYDKFTKESYSDVFIHFSKIVKPNSFSKSCSLLKFFTSSLLCGHFLCDVYALKLFLKGFSGLTLINFVYVSCILLSKWQFCLGNYSFYYCVKIYVCHIVVLLFFPFIYGVISAYAKWFEMVW